MGFFITKTRQPYSSRSVHSKTARGAFNLSALGVRLTAPARASIARAPELRDSELAVFAESQGLGGNFRNSTAAIMKELGRDR